MEVEVMVTCALQAVVSIQHGPKLTKTPVALNLTSLSDESIETVHRSLS